MRLVIQRVKKASVEIVKTKKVVGKINSGLFVLVGVSGVDSLKNAEVLAEKLAKLRIMKDDAGKMNLAVAETGAKMLVVSQFTLYGDASKGNRPSFVKAAQPEKAKKIYDFFVDKLRQKGMRVETGNFGDYMEIEAQLDGPVTILLEN